jgi:phage baseplate assembly protein V
MLDKLRNLLARGVVSLVQAGLKMQTLQVRVLEGEVIDSVEHIEPYGLTAQVLPGAEAFIIFLGADRSHGVVISAPDRRYRPTDLQPGEVCIFDHLGQRVHLTASGIVIKGAGLPVTITDTPKITLDAPETEITGNLTVFQNISAGLQIIDMAQAGGRTMSAMRATYDSHDHDDSLGGKTTAPNQKTAD